MAKYRFMICGKCGHDQAAPDGSCANCGRNRWVSKRSKRPPLELDDDRPTYDPVELDLDLDLPRQ